MHVEKTDVLLVKNDQSEKYATAKRHAIPCVGADWVETSVSLGCCAPFDAFKYCTDVSTHTLSSLLDSSNIDHNHHVSTSLAQSSAIETLGTKKNASCESELKSLFERVKSEKLSKIFIDCHFALNGFTDPEQKWL